MNLQILDVEIIDLSYPLILTMDLLQLFYINTFLAMEGDKASPERRCQMVGLIVGPKVIVPSLEKLVQHCFLSIKVSRSKSFFKSCKKFSFRHFGGCPIVVSDSIYCLALGVQSFIILIVCVFSSFLAEHFSMVCLICVLILVH